MKKMEQREQALEKRKESNAIIVSFLYSRRESMLLLMQMK